MSLFKRTPDSYQIVKGLYEEAQRIFPLAYHMGKNDGMDEMEIQRGAAVYHRARVMLALLEAGIPYEDAVAANNAHVLILGAKMGMGGKV